MSGAVSRQTCREEGQALVEYSLILAFIAIVAVLILQTLGANVVGALTSAANGF